MSKRVHIPELRFKEFSGEWEEKKFGDIFERVTTKNKENNLNVLTISAQQGLISQEEYFNKSVSAKDVTEYYLLHKNDFAYNKSYSNGYPMGAIKRLSKYDKGVVSTLYICFKSKKDNVIFLEKYFDTTKWYKEVHKIAQEGVRNHGLLNISVVEFFRDVKIIIPKKTEQQKIASFLTTIDTKIEQLSKKVEFQEQYKKGVMQKIFNQEIRFKKDDGSEFDEWEEKRLEEFLILTLREVPKPKENYLAIGVKSHCKGTFQRPNSEPHKIAMDKLYKVKENDLIVSITFAWESAIAIVNKNDEGGLVSHRFPTYTFKKDKVIVEFFRYVIIQKKFRFMLNLISPGGAGRNRVMSKKDFLKLKWILPPIEEQTKIANFLISLDKQIDSTKEQLAKTKEFKKGLLQRMFV